jgi:hypothetical protein
MTDIAQCIFHGMRKGLEPVFDVLSNLHWGDQGHHLAVGKETLSQPVLFVIVSDPAELFMARMLR